jgi:purine-binding chemotaxis protein CheW
MSQSLAVMDNQSLTHTGGYASQQEFVTMRVANQLFGISVLAVQDVLRNQKIAKVPLSQPVIAGSLNLRGRIVTAIDMRVRLGMAPFESYQGAMHIVVPFKDELFSLVVDKVGEVMSLPMADFEKVPANMEARWRELSSGVFKLNNELLIIVNVASIMQMS